MQRGGQAEVILYLRLGGAPIAVLPAQRWHPLRTILALLTCCRWANFIGKMYMFLPSCISDFGWWLTENQSPSAALAPLPIVVRGKGWDARSGCNAAFVASINRQKVVQFFFWCNKDSNIAENNISLYGWAGLKICSVFRLGSYYQGKVLLLGDTQAAIYSYWYPHTSQPAVHLRGNRMKHYAISLRLHFWKRKHPFFARKCSTAAHSNENLHKFEPSVTFIPSLKNHRRDLGQSRICVWKNVAIVPAAQG